MSRIGDMISLYKSAEKSRASSKHSSRWSGSQESSWSKGSSKGGRSIKPRDFKSAIKEDPAEINWEDSFTKTVQKVKERKNIPVHAKTNLNIFDTNKDALDELIEDL